MVKQRFRVSGKITKLLGTESVSDKVTALHEVLKNSHDADALYVDIKFEDFEDNRGKIILKEEKGDGMTLDDIKNKFFIIGTYSKQPKKAKDRVRKTKRLKRVMIGRKGVGRFALEKLGKVVKIISKPYGKKEKNTFEIDWRRFEPHKITIDQVSIEVTKQTRKDIHDSGLEIIISNLNDVWDEESINEFMERVKNLTLPKQLRPKKNPFKIFMESPYFGIERHEIISSLEETAFYKLEAELKADSISIKTEKLGEEYFEEEIKQFTSSITNEVRKVSDLVSGHAKLIVYYYPTYLKGDPLKKYYYDEGLNHYSEDLLSRIPDMLYENHGVKIIKDGVREFRYGDPGFDWTDRAKISRNLSGTIQADRLLGYCLISGEKNPKIVPTTNRTEALQNTEFLDLKDFVISSMITLDRRIHYDRKNLMKDYKEKIKPTVDNLKKLQTAFTRKSIQEKVKELEDAIETEFGEQFFVLQTIKSALKVATSKQEEYEELTTKDEMTLSNSLLGEYFIKHYHDRVEPVKDTTKSDLAALDAFRRRKEVKDDPDLQSIVNDLKESWDMLEVVFDVIDAGIQGLSVEEFFKKDKVRVSLYPYFNKAFEGLKKLFEFENVQLDNKINEHLELEVYGPLLHSLTYNLISNSLKAFDDQHETGPDENKIKASSVVQDNYVIMQFSDNVIKGIPEDRWNLVFEEFIGTTGKREKIPGYGLGLSILKRMLQKIDGSIKIIPPVLGSGTTFEIRIPDKYVVR